MQALSRLQQSAALPVALVAVVVTLSGDGGTPLATGLFFGGAVALVVAVLIATVGLTKNQSRLADPAHLLEVINAGWQEDDEVTARHNVVVEQVQQMKELDKVCIALDSYRKPALVLQCAGLLAVIVAAGVLVV